MKKLRGYSLPSSVMLLNLLPISTQPTRSSLALSQVFIDFKFSHKLQVKPDFHFYTTLSEWSPPVLYIIICCLLARPALSPSNTNYSPGGEHSAPPTPLVFPPRPSPPPQVPPFPLPTPAPIP